MRVGKKPNVVEAKKTRSCVVRLEKVSNSSPNVSPSTETKNNITRPTRLSSSSTSVIMGATPKGRRGAPTTQQQQQQTSSGPIKKRLVGASVTNTPQQKASAAVNISSLRSNQKIKIIPRSNKTTPASTPSRDETPPPTIAAGRSRRAIKPNPKYASEDLVTPKVVRNVASLGSAGSRGATSGQGSKGRKNSTSSDDFYNRNSDDDFEDNPNDDRDEDEDMHNDKAYQVNEKDENDSDFSVVEEQPVRSRGRPRKVDPSLSTPANNKLSTQAAASSQLRRNTSSANTNSSATNLRSAPSQLQQIRRSLATANAQRNLNLLAGSGATAQKRKLEEIQDSSDNDTSYTVTRKQILLSNASGQKVKVPVRENSKINATSTPLTKTRVGLQKPNTAQTPSNINQQQQQQQKQQQQQTINGSNRINNSQTLNSNRRAIEITAKSNTDSITRSSLRQTSSTASASNQNTKSQTQQTATTQAKLLASKVNRLRSGSPKLPTLRDRQNNVGATNTISLTSSSTSSSSSASDKTKVQQATASASTKTTKSSTSSPHNAAPTASAITTENTIEIKDDSPNSTIDDFETMPTFTIVNVNDIINKKGDVLITKSKSNNSNKTTPTVIEFSESISLDDEDEDDQDEQEVDLDDLRVKTSVVNQQSKQSLNKKLPKLPTLNNRKEFENKKSSPLNRSNDTQKKLTTSSTPAPQILNHKLGLRNSRVTAKTTTTLTATLKSSPDKPAPRILNSVVAKKTQPVKPMIANLDDSADESIPLSLDEDEDEEEEPEEETEDEVESRGVSLMQTRRKHQEQKQQQRQNLMEVDTEDTESQNTEDEELLLQASTTNTSSNSASNVAALTPKQNQNIHPQRRRRAPTASTTPIVVSSNKKRMTPAAAKENSLAATNQQVQETKTNTPLPTTRKTPPEKVVISKQGDKIIKKITCFETWYVINMPLETKRPTTAMKNQLEMPLIHLANNAKNISLPNDRWSSKVTLYELSPQTLGKGTYVTYTGDLFEHNINEEDRGKYQPSCVMFRRSVEKNQVTRMPYDRAVIFKNKTFYTNIEGKNVRLLGAPSIISAEREIEILLEVVDSLTLQSDFVEHISIVQ